MACDTFSNEEYIAVVFPATSVEVTGSEAMSPKFLYFVVNVSDKDSEFHYGKCLEIF